MGSRAGVAEVHAAVVCESALESVEDVVTVEVKDCELPDCVVVTWLDAETEVVVEGLGAKAVEDRMV